jgi:hypothetical protein
MPLRSLASPDFFPAEFPVADRAWFECRQRCMLPSGFPRSVARQLAQHTLPASTGPDAEPPPPSYRVDPKRPGRTETAELLRRPLSLPPPRANPSDHRRPAKGATRRQDQGPGPCRRRGRAGAGPAGATHSNPSRMLFETPGASRSRRCGRVLLSIGSSRVAAAGFTIDDVVADNGVRGVATRLVERPEGRRLFDKVRAGDV